MADSDRSQLIWLAEVAFCGNPHRQAILAEHLSRQFDVLFVEPARKLRPPALSIERQNGLRVAQAVPLLNARPLPLRFVLGSIRARRLAARLGAAQVLRHARAIRWNDAGKGIVVCSNVYLAAAIPLLRPAVVVVDICDDPRFYPGEPTWTEELLVTCLQRADIVTSSSRALQASLQALGGRRVEYVSNGVPSWIVNVGRAKSQQTSGVVGFLGHIGPWVDIELLERLADSLPATTLEVAGTIDDAMIPAFERLRRRANVRYLGAVPYDQVPGVLARFDVGLIPFVESNYTRGVNPLKLYEYAALNLPIVSSPFSVDVLEFSDVVDVCDSCESFISTVLERLLGRGMRDTRWLAESHTWEAIARNFLQLIDAKLEMRRYRL